MTESAGSRGSRGRPERMGSLDRMNADTFRELALALPGVVEGSHQGHADFRVGGKVMATLGPDESWAMVKLPPDAQADLVEHRSGAFEPFAGAWGKAGCTRVTLADAPRKVVADALGEALEFVRG